MIDDFFDRLIITAATFDELLSSDFVAIAPRPEDVARAERRLVAWCRSCANGNWNAFELRLQQCGYSIERAREQFTAVRRAEAAPTPKWFSDAIWIDRVLQPSTPLSQDSSSRTPYPFERLFLPLADEAERLLWDRFDRSADVTFTSEYRCALRSILLRSLTELAAPALYEEFSASRKRSFDEKPSEFRTGSFDSFCEKMAAGGFRCLFNLMPVLLRLLATVTRQWIDTNAEVHARLQEDIGLIKEAFGLPSGPQRVVSLEDGLSDPHNHGRTVKILQFESGDRIVYKPRDVGLDLAANKMADQLVRSGAPIIVKAPQIVARSGYGWAEYIASADCHTSEQGRLFFSRAGAWLAIFHCLGGGDLHHENLIACGDHPIPVDFETIVQLRGKRSGLAEHDAWAAAEELISESVTHVGLLPAFGLSPQRQPFAFGGLNAGDTLATELQWRSVNSDDMRPERVMVRAPSTANLPSLNGKRIELCDYIDDFIAGFTEMSRFVVTDRAAADLINKTLHSIESLQSRYIARPTRFYYMLLSRLRDCRTMSDGALWSVQVDFLNRLDGHVDGAHRVLLHEGERRALLSLCVPHFTTACASTTIQDSASVSAKVSGFSPVERARARFSSYTESEIQSQIAIIRQCSCLPETRTRNAVLRLAKKPGDIGRSGMLHECRRIAEMVCARSIRRGVTATWIGLDRIGDTRYGQITPMGVDFYNGSLGVAYFLAAYHSVTGCGEAREIALEAVSTTKAQLVEFSDARVALRFGVGGASGLGSVIYGLLAISALLKVAALQQDALRAVELLTDELIASDKALDLMDGSAGAICALLRLYREVKSELVIDRAIRCGEHLLNCRPVKSLWGSPGAGGRPLNGAAHGAAGFSMALARLAGETGRSDFAKAARDCIEFENASFERNRCDWPDLRGDHGPLWPCAWCHGAAGIGLSRIAVLRSRINAFDVNGLKTDIRNAAYGVLKSSRRDTDTICCGEMGRIEFLAQAGVTLNEPNLTKAGYERLTAVINNAELSDYRWHYGDSMFNLGLFRGIAGIGYTILRHLDDTLPCPLTWD